MIVNRTPQPLCYKGDFPTIHQKSTSLLKTNFGPFGHPLESKIQNSSSNLLVRTTVDTVFIHFPLDRIIYPRGLSQTPKGFVNYRMKGDWWINTRDFAQLPEGISVMRISIPYIYPVIRYLLWLNREASYYSFTRTPAPKTFCCLTFSSPDLRKRFCTLIIKQPRCSNHTSEDTSLF